MKWDMPKITSVFSRPSSREPLPASKKNAVRERARNKCEFIGCNEKRNLQFHHKNMKNHDNRISNIELLCPNHHARRHDDKFRQFKEYDVVTGTRKTRLVKKSKGKKKIKKPKGMFDFCLEC
jgi:hypothetical protein